MQLKVSHSSPTQPTQLTYVATLLSTHSHSPYAAQGHPIAIMHPSRPSLMPHMQPHFPHTSTMQPYPTQQPICNLRTLTGHPHNPHLHHVVAPLSHLTLTAHKAPTRPPYPPPTTPLIFKPTKPISLSTFSIVHYSWNSAPMQPTLIP